MKAYLIELQKQVHEDWLKNYDDDHNNLDALMADFGTFALKASMLINGGALVSIFAFFSQIITSENSNNIALIDLFSAFKNSVLFWILGLCSCLLSIGLTYAHYYLQTHNVNVEFKDRWKDVYNKFPDKFEKLKPTWLDAGLKFAPYFFGASIISGYISVLFLFGGFWFCVDFIYSFPDFISKKP